MGNPKRILKKILGEETDLEPFEKTGEPMDLLVETLRSVQKCRKTRNWLIENCGLDPLLPPAVFHSLLSIPEINSIETANRDLEVEISHLNETRNPEDPVNISNLNAVLREIFRNLQALNDRRCKNFPTLLLGKEISGDLIDRVEGYTTSLRSLDWKGVGYLLTGWKAFYIEKNFRNLFPDSPRVHPLRKKLSEVESELVFYRQCLEINIKWGTTGLDLFRVLREENLPLTLENLQEMGNGLWNIVYNGLRLKKSLNLAGILFDDSRTLLDPSLAPLSAEAQGGQVSS